MMDTQSNTNKYLILEIVTSIAVSSGSVGDAIGIEVTAKWCWRPLRMEISDCILLDFIIQKLLSDIG